MGNNSLKFLTWLKQNNPFMYAVAERAYQYQENGSGMGVFNIGDFLKSAISTVTTIAPKVMEYNQQKKLLDVQIARAKQNLPPLDTAPYQVVNPAFNPNNPTYSQQAYIDQLAREATYQPQSSNNFSAYLPIIGLGIGAFILIKAVKK